MGKGTVRHRSSLAGRSSTGSSRSQIYVGLGLAGAAVLILVIFLVSGGGGRRTVPDAGTPESPSRKPVSAPSDPAVVEVRSRPAPEAPKPEPYPKDLAEIDGYVLTAMAADEYGRALGILQTSRGRYPLMEWKAAVDKRVQRLKEEAGRAYAGLEVKALEARRRGAEDEVRAARQRVAKWALEEYPPRLEKALASVPAGEQPWKILFDGSSMSFIVDERGWRLEGGALVKVLGGPVPAETRENFTDGEIRIRFRAAPPGYVFFAVRQGLSGNSGVHLDEEALRALGTAEHVLSFSMDGEAVTAALDGKPVRVSTMGRPRTGSLQFNAQGASLRVSSVEYRLK